MLKQMLYAGIGLAEVAKEKAEDIVAELVKKGEISKEEGRDILSTFKIWAQEGSKKLKYKVSKHIENTISSMNIVRKAELTQVLKKLSELEKELKEIRCEKEV